MATISLTFPDGNIRKYPAGVTPSEVAGEISTSLAKKAISATVDGVHWDMQWPIEQDASITLNTMADDGPALELIRHDLAHIMARAVQEIWPDVKVTIGPVIQHGWYYDFDRADPFTPEDLGAIEKKMKEIINARDPVRTEVWDRERALAHYRATGENFKVELVEAIPEDQKIRMYWHGPWQDLCRGPHLQHTGQVPADAFKLMSVAGAYWRGDSAHLTRLEEAAKRDHRKLGRGDGSFHFQAEAVGSVFWHPNGFMIWRILEQYMRRQLDADGYRRGEDAAADGCASWREIRHWGKFARTCSWCPTRCPDGGRGRPIRCSQARRT
jgi:threonyl-tRNA synthetase